MGQKVVLELASPWVGWDVHERAYVQTMQLINEPPVVLIKFRGSEDFRIYTTRSARRAGLF